MCTVFVYAAGDGEPRPVCPGAEVMRGGRVLTEDGLLRPLRARPCSALCVSGLLLGKFAGCVADEARRCGAGTVFLDGDAEQELADALRGEGLGVCSPGRKLHGCELVLPDLPPPCPSKARAVLPRRRRSVLTGSALPPETLTQRELSALLAGVEPRVQRSEELIADYFTYSSGGRTYFVLYDTPETLRRRAEHLLTDEGCELAFLQPL